MHATNNFGRTRKNRCQFYYLVFNQSTFDYYHLCKKNQISLGEMYICPFAYINGIDNSYLYSNLHESCKKVVLRRRHMCRIVREQVVLILEFSVRNVS